MRKIVIGSLLVAVIAVPALAMLPEHGHMMKGPQTRAGVEAKVKEHFAMIDTNKDGAITKEEMDAFKTTRREKMHDQVFAMMDTDKNGQISKAEFDARHEGKGMHGHDGMKGAENEAGDAGRMGHHRMMRGMRGGMMFDAADANKDGKVTLDEATSNALAMFDKADANKDGTVTPEERRAAWQSWREKRKSNAG